VLLGQSHGKGIGIRNTMVSLDVGGSQYPAAIDAQKEYL
jgi:hypothetical protein